MQQISSMEIATPSIMPAKFFERLPKQFQNRHQQQITPIPRDASSLYMETSTSSRKANMMIMIFLLMRYLNVRLLRF